MSEIIRNFIKERNKIINEHSTLTESQRLAYLDERTELRRQLALILSQLVSLLFKMEIDDTSTQYEKIWKAIHSKISALKLPSSRCYCIYRSPIRGSLDTELVKITSRNPNSNHILISDGSLVFTVDGETIHGVLNQEFIRLVIDAKTQINIPKDLIQFNGDSISIEYVDVFFSRNKNGEFKGHKYRGFDMGRYDTLKEKTKGFLTISNIRDAINIGTKLLYLDQD